MHKMIDFYERLLDLLSQYKNEIKIVELNEDPFIKDEKFEIHLSAFMLYIKNFEYLLFTQLNNIENFKKSDLKRYFDVFSEYYNKRAFIIVWNDKDFNSILVNIEDLYKPIDKVFQTYQSNLIPLDKLLSEKIRKKRVSKTEVKFHKKEELDIKTDFKKKIYDNFESKFKKVQKKLQNDFKKMINKKNLDQMINIFNEFFNSEIDEKDVRKKLLKFYQFKE